MDAWFEMVVLVLAVAAIGTTVLAPRFESEAPPSVVVRHTQCIALRADALDPKPKCATTVAVAVDSAFIKRDDRMHRGRY